MTRDDKIESVSSVVSCVSNVVLFLIPGYLLSVLLRKPIHRGSPVFVSIEPTNHCNLHCPECPTGQRGLTRAAGSLSLNDFRKYLDQISRCLRYITLYFQGEPYLNRDLFKMIEYARGKNIYVWSSTNGHFLSEENIRETIASGLNKLVISLDGTDQETYQQYRVSGSYQRVVEGLRDFVRIRNEAGIRLPHLEIQFLVLKSNEHQIKEIKKLGNSLGVDRVVLKTAQFCDFEYGNPLMPEGRWSRYKRTGRQADKRTSGQADDQIIIKSAHQHISTSSHHHINTSTHQHITTSSHHHINTSSHHHISTSPHQHIITSPHQHIIKHPLRNRCFRMWAGCVITWDGKVVPCCFDKDAAHALGDLNKQSFGEIWRGEAYRQFRHSVFINRKSVEICRNCSQRW